MNALCNLQNRVALVTGASQGLGRVIAETYAAARAHVLVNSRHVDRCERFATAINSVGHKASPLAFDVNDRTAVVAAYKKFEVLEQLDILVNNVGFRLREPADRKSYVTATTLNIDGATTTYSSE